MDNVNPKAVMVGVVSRGKGCARKDAPGNLLTDAAGVSSHLIV